MGGRRMSGQRLGSSGRIECCARLKRPISTPNRPSRAFPAPLWPPQCPIDATGMRTPQKHSALLSASTKQIKRLLPRNVGAAVPEGPLYGIPSPETSHTCYCVEPVCFTPSQYSTDSSAVKRVCSSGRRILSPDRQKNGLPNIGRPDSATCRPVPAGTGGGPVSVGR